MSSIRKVGWALFTKASILTAIVLTYAYHTNVKKIDYNIFEKKTEAAPYFYSNPAILEVKWQSNNRGMLETYMTNQETGKQIEIMYDMLPKNSTMVEVMKKRIQDGYQEKGFDYNSLEEVLEFESQQNEPASLWDRIMGNSSDR
ncbi:hypothetical protein ACFLTH_17010 [Bacteroidota bacterium]